MTPQSAITPIRTCLTWMLSAAAGAAGLALAHGFRQPSFAGTATLLLAASLALFVLSRALTLWPVSRVRERLAHWWLDYVLILGGLLWWLVQPASGWFILRAAAVYVIAAGAGSILRAGVSTLADGLPNRTVGSAVRRLLGIALVLAVVGGSILALPVCRRAAEAVEAGHPLAFYQLKVEWLNATFTATAALTGTGLSIREIGYDYNRLGQFVLLVLMEIGGLGILSIGAIIGLQFRRLLGYGAEDDDPSPGGMRRAVVFVCVLAVLVQVLGAVGLYRMWDSAADLNFGTATREPALLGSVMKGRSPWADYYDEARLFAAVFHSVSAFTDTGLTLTRDGYVAYRHHPGPLLAIMPLMFLGSLGGPVLLELLKRLTRRGGMGLEALSKDTWITVVGSVAALAAGTGLLITIESTRELQQRYPQEKTPGRLMVSDSATGTPALIPSRRSPATQPGERAPIDFSAVTRERARAERLSGMSPGNRFKAALFQAEAARTGGAKSARLDESSLSPASHFVLMGLMLLGGGMGGAAGGLRIVIVWILVGALLTGGRPRKPDPYASPEIDVGRGVGIAAAIATAMLLLIALVAVFLLYYESVSPLACIFEAVSACCNVGLSLGLTSELSLPGRATIILAMLLGRLIPVAILMRCFLQGSIRLPRPLLERAVRPKTEVECTALDDDAPIPLE